MTLVLPSHKAFSPSQTRKAWAITLLPQCGAHPVGVAIGADSSIISRLEVDMTMKIATELAVVTALSTALGVLITVLAGTLMTTYI